MLIMKCPECQERILSDLLAEVQILTCPYCRAQVPVSDIQVSANGLTFERNDLIKNLFRYKKMLQETMAERRQIEKGAQIGDKRQRQRIDHLIGALQGVMEGARSHIRYQFNPSVQFSLGFRDQKINALLVNLSLDGCRLAIPLKGVWPKRGERLEVEMKLHAPELTLLLTGKACWVHPADEGELQGSMIAGVIFDAVSVTEQGQIWSFICALVDSESLLLET
jgi:hypothetical protein